MLHKMMLFFKLVSLLVWVIVGVGGAHVDTSKPNLDVYKLRRVDAAQVARDRVQRPIRELWSGAQHMHESLITSSRHVACPAYAHLFRLIQHHNSGRSPIRQATVEALAVVVTQERPFYFNLLTRHHDYLLAATEHFMEAAQQLERRQLAEADAYLDLIGCLRDFMSVGTSLAPKVHDFLDEPKRAKLLEQMAQFKSIPIEKADINSPPAGMVRGLAKRLDGDLAHQPPNADDFRQAQQLIESLDDELTANYRRQMGREAGQEWAEPRGDPPEEAHQPPAPAALAVAVEPPRPLELVVGKADKGAPGQSGRGRFDAGQLAVLKFIKMRLEQPQTSRWFKPARLSMRLAYDYQNHWRDLLAYRPPPPNSQEEEDDGAFGRLAEAFRRNPENGKLARRVHKAIGAYEELVGVLGAMQDKRLKSLEQLSRPLERVAELLAHMDDAFDLDDIRRLNAMWRVKYHEYATIDKFINGAFW